MERPSLSSRSRKDFLHAQLRQKISALCLSRSSKALLRYLVFFHVRGKAIFPGQKLLASRMKCSVRTIGRLLKDLEEQGLLTRTGQRSRLKTQFYVLHIQSFDLLLTSPPLVPFPSLESPENRETLTPSKPLPQALSRTQMSGQMSDKLREYKDKKRAMPQEKGGGRTEASGSTPLPSSPPKVVPLVLTRKDQHQAQQLLEALSKASQGRIVPDARYSHTPRRVLTFFHRSCKGSWALWEEFCAAVGSSELLTGQGRKGYVPPLLWLLTEEVRVRLAMGEFHKSRTLPTSRIRSLSPEGKDRGSWSPGSRSSLSRGEDAQETGAVRGRATGSEEADVLSFREPGGRFSVSSSSQTRTLRSGFEERGPLPSSPDQDPDMSYFKEVIRRYSSPPVRVSA